MARTPKDRAQGQTLTLAIPPSINSYHRSVTLRGGVSKVLISKQGRAWRKSSSVAAQMQWRGPPLEGPVVVTVRVYFKNRRRDLGNVEKPLSDLLNTIAYRDDRQIAELHLYKFFDSGNPRVEVTIRAADATRLEEAA